MRRAILTVVVSVCFFAGVSAVSAASIWVSAKGAKQGTLMGSGIAGHDTESAALGLDFSAAANVASGPTLGQVTYKQMKLYRALDVVSVQLFEAMVGNELLDPVVISVWGPTAQGKEEAKYRITLGKARVAGLRYLSAYSAGAPSVAFSTPGGIVEEVSLTFDRIEMLYPPNGTVAVDSAAGRVLIPRALGG
jgi:type VI secretion system Hcp family effector